MWLLNDLEHNFLKVSHLKHLAFLMSSFTLYLLYILAYEYIIMIEIVSKLHNLQSNFYISAGVSLIVINKETGFYAPKEERNLLSKEGS